MEFHQASQQWFHSPAGVTEHWLSHQIATAAAFTSPTPQKQDTTEELQQHIEKL